jgi:hypothetical protein
MFNCSVTISTVSHKTLETHFPLIRSLNALNQSNCLHVLHSKIGGYAYVAKIKTALTFFEHHVSSYIVLIDAFDVYFRHSLDTCLTQLKLFMEEQLLPARRLEKT